MENAMALTSAITEAAFAKHRQRDWVQLEALTRKATMRGLRALSADEVARVPPLYRDVCADLARSQSQAARYSAPLVEYLQGLTAAAHTMFYGAQGQHREFTPAHASTRAMGLRSALTAFPRALRRHPWALLFAFALFFIPFIAGIASALHDPMFAFRVVPESMLRPLTEHYARGFDQGRDGGEATMMAGFYVNNNVGIALRCFALGIFGGVGSAFYLVDNGLTIGATLGYVASQGAGHNIVTFIVGHGTLELGAIVIAGGAGLALGWSIVAPGSKTRLASVQHVANDIVAIVFGAALMLLMAAAVEGFWSGSSVPAAIKQAVGATLFVVVLGYLAFAGRGVRDAGARNGHDA
jgi:uncharacterized membrane protein SpoIIM required for sporulation